MEKVNTCMLRMLRMTCHSMAFKIDLVIIYYYYYYYIIIIIWLRLTERNWVWVKNSIIGLGIDTIVMIDTDEASVK